jgi:uncharacterized protein (TIGR02421 family)
MTRETNLFTRRAAQQICSRIAENKRVRRSLPVWGRVHVDRLLPFLCVYRRPAGREDPGTSGFAAAEASYVLGSGHRKVQAGFTELVREIGRTISGEFGSCLVLEIWSGGDNNGAEPVTISSLEPGFRFFVQKGTDVTGFVNRFNEILSRVRVAGSHADVGVVPSARVSPPRLPPILSREDAAEVGCHLFGLEVAPVYRDPATGEIFDGVYRQMRQRLTVALRRIFYEYARAHTTHRPPHFHALGRRATVKAVWEADRILTGVSDSFDFLLQLTPVNAEEAWNKFRRFRYDRVPRFHYRPLRVEPVTLKRRLYRAPVERIEDPALGQIFREKVDELDRQITLLKDRNSSRFVHESEQLFGGVEDSLFDLAVEILERTPPRSRDEALKDALDAEAFAARAREEIAHYRAALPGLDARVEVRRDVSTLMVSRGSLLVAASARVPASRVEALIQHEVGTHVLTYHNGRAQRLGLLSTGLAGYDALQEGLAVLSEYLVGGLSRPRLRLLAARVVAARGMLDGASFIDVYRVLASEHGFAGQVAFNVAMRTFRGGGLTKDAVYLRGLEKILRYLAKGGDLGPLYVGKIGAEHIPVVKELLWRKVLEQPPLEPRYLGAPATGERLARLKAGMTVMDLVENGRRRR